MKRRVIIILAAVVIAVVIILSFLFIVLRPSQGKDWYFFDYLSGQGDYESPTFTLQNQWRVRWAYRNSTAFNLFGAFVYGKLGITFSPILSVTQDDTNETNGVLDVNYTGSFYIRVISVDSVHWNMTVEEYR